MNVNTVGTTSVLAGASSAAGVSGASSTDPVAGIDALFPATQSSISGPGSLFGELASLAQSDPDQFKKVASETAQRLKDAAASATGDEAKFLSGMADKFGQAAQSGDASVLRPGGPDGAQHPHRHHQHGGSGQAAGDSGSSAFEVLSQIVSSALQGADTAGSASMG